MIPILQQYLDLGWYLLPIHEITNGACSCGEACTSPGKHPRSGLGLKHATQDTGVIDRWITRWPHCSWAVACFRSGFIAIDVDPRSGGNATFGQLEADHGELPAGPLQKTGGDGRHYLVTVPRGVKLRGKLGNGVDLKANGYILIEPSNHASGGLYVWATAPWNAPAPPMPASWLAVAEKREAVARHAPRQYQADDDADIEAALAVIPADDRDVWLQIGMAIHDAMGEGGYSLWDRWSQSSSKYNERDQRRTWDGIKPGGGVTKATLFREAMLHGWEQPGQALRVVRPDDAPPPHTDDDAPPELDTGRERGDEWRAGLVYADKDRERVTRDAGNAALIMVNDPGWHGCLRHNKFSQEIEWSAPCPRMLGYPIPEGVLMESHVGYVAHWLKLQYGGSFSVEATRNAIHTAAGYHGYHPVVEYLSRIVWDEVPRLATWLRDYLCADDTAMTGQLGYWWLISAVARVFRPGCQVDHTLILEGAQGVGKSSALAILGGDWFKSSLGDLGGKEGRLGLHGSWIIEIAELDSFRGQRSTAIKNFLTEREDKIRPLYGREPVAYPRQCVFAGSTNETEYLRDGTGARRFWPVKMTHLRRTELQSDRDQLWAEAVHCFKAGATWWGTTPEQEQALGAIQEERYAVDPWEARIRPWLETRTLEINPEIDVGELWQILDIGYDKQDRYGQTRLGVIVHRCGWEKFRKQVDGKRVARYRPEK